MNNLSKMVRRYWISMAIYFILAATAFFVCPFIGSEKITLANILKSNSNNTQFDIFYNLRLPRVILGFLAGGTLAVSGAVFQIILRNPLATPYTLGVTGGSAVGAFLAISLGIFGIKFMGLGTIEIFSLAGACLVFAVIYFIACNGIGISMNSLLLAGVTLGIFSSALILLIRYISEPNILVSMDRWVMGSLDISGYRQIAALMPLLLPGLGLLFMQTGRLNHLSFGQELAMGYGIDVNSVQRYCFAGGSLATAAIVSAAGPIAFVGLIVPHCIRSISGFDHKLVLPASFLIGGAFLITCDTLARVIIAPSQIPVGIITAMLGGPFFIYLLIKK